MKIIIAITFIFFMGVSVYLLLKEKNIRTTHSKVITPKFMSHAKKIEGPTTLQLQKKEMEANTIYKFESKNKKNDFELNDVELEKEQNNSRDGLLKSK
jgi:hypothetical protein